jgi:hypothetical protein
VWRTPLTTRVILISLTVPFYTRGSRTLRVGGGGNGGRGGCKGERTSGVFVKATRRVERDAELFANYGTEFRFPGGWVWFTWLPGDT